MMCKAQHN